MKNLKWAAGLILLGAIFCLGLIVGARMAQFPSRRATLQITSGPALLTRIQSLAELVTVKYVIEKVVLVEDVKWYGQNRVLIVAHGVVKAGVDLNRLRPEDIQVHGRKVTINLPPAQVMDAYLDDTQTKVIEHSTGLLRAFDKDLQQTARQTAIDDIRRAARLGGILTEAEQRAKNELRIFLSQLGFEEVSFGSPQPAPAPGPHQPKP
ncbi:MAG: DUF4230 domain-containing protein [Verrucomicrobiae bacterium]|nr:DUF4230 domain-containing protein [Verrucomicrobiae bacterium]